MVIVEELLIAGGWQFVSTTAPSNRSSQLDEVGSEVWRWKSSAKAKERRKHSQTAFLENLWRNEVLQTVASNKDRHVCIIIERPESILH